MAQRRLGTLPLQENIETEKQMPLDARQLVRSKEEMLTEGSFIYGYKGLFTAERTEGKLWMLMDHQNPTQESSWKVIGPYDDSALDARVTALENASPSEQVQANWSETDTTSKAFIQNKPSFASVATSGSYNDLADRPVLPAPYDDSALSGRVSALENAGFLTEHQDISGKANIADLSAVATSGSYNDLSDQPTIPEAYDDTAIQAALAGKADASSLANVATSGSYNDLGDKPTIPEAYDDSALAARIAAVETTLPNKANSADLANVATSGSYNDLGDKPTIPEAYDDTALAARVSANETALADHYTKAETDGKIAEAMVDVDNEHFHPVTVLPDSSVAKENHEYVLVTYAQDGTTIESETHYLFYDGVFHEKQTQVSLDGYATEAYVNNALPTIDSAMSDTSENPVQNKVVFAAIGDAIDVVDTAVQGLDTRVTAAETALAGKADASSLATVATSGSYNDLTDQPTIPESYDDTALAARVTALEAGDHVELTQAQYDALTTEEKNNGKVYFVTDGEGGSGGSSTSLRNGSFTQSWGTVDWETDDNTYIEFFIHYTFNVNLTAAKGALFGTSIEFSMYISEIQNQTGIFIPENATMLNFVCWAQRSDITPILTCPSELRASVERLWFRTHFFTTESKEAAPTDISWRIKVAINSNSNPNS